MGSPKVSLPTLMTLIDKDESRNIFTDVTSIFLVDLFSFFNIYIYIKILMVLSGI